MITSGALRSAKRAQRSIMVRKFGYLPIPEIVIRDPTPDRPSAPQVYQCKITQSTGMATQMQLEVILTGNRIATRV